ncbi:uncharacterized protein LOC120108750 [Phoenix dactylifera]|uniref:Uncharacterized protein LOC120108750 n=1 Tax=Phoenix dactylifera TaxID=42345 RepID=A0A8B8ZVS7_PHODC|nr:uncharacterized protein LOC120108750 [Phoenix dactylifera]
MTDAEPSSPSSAASADFSCAAVCSTSATAAEASPPPSSVCSACGGPTASISSAAGRHFLGFVADLSHSVRGRKISATFLLSIFCAFIMNECRNNHFYDESRRVRLKSTKNVLNISKLKKNDLSAGCLEHETCKVSFAPDKGFVDASANLSPELCVEDHSTLGSLGLSIERSFEAFRPLQTGNISSNNIISDGEAVAAASRRPASLPLEPTHVRAGGDLKSCDPAVLILDENKDVEEPSKAKEQLENIFVPDDSHIPVSTAMKHDGPKRPSPPYEANPVRRWLELLKCAQRKNWKMPLRRPLRSRKTACALLRSWCIKMIQARSSWSGDQESRQPTVALQIHNSLLSSPQKSGYM